MHPSPAESWRSVVGFPGYEVSDLGRIRSFNLRGYGTRLAVEPHPIRERRNNCGYPTVPLCARGVKSAAFVHRLVLTAFVGPCPDGMEGCHDNGDRTDNRATNLRWDTRRNNHADKAAHGTRQTGERHGRAVLTDAQVTEIRRRRAAGETIVALGRAFGTAHSNISRVCLNRTWNHLES